jgi:hypothetical protein
MRQSAGNWFLMALAAIALAACSGDKSKTEPDPNIFPARYKEEILFTITPLLMNPSLVRDAYITDPAIGTVGREQRYIVCVRSNSRDVNGQYEGIKDRIAYFFAGHLNLLVDATKEQCGNASY